MGSIRTSVGSFMWVPTPNSDQPAAVEHKDSAAAQFRKQPVTVSTKAEERDAADRTVGLLALCSPMRAAIGFLMQGRLADAENVVRRHLARARDDVAALCLLGDLAARSGIHAEAERLFRGALAVLPRFTDAQYNLAKLLALRDGLTEAIELLDDILQDRPDRLDVAAFRLDLLGQIGDYERAASDYAALLAHRPDRPDLWTRFGNLQATRGDLSSSIAAYCRALDMDIRHGEAWWGLANLKTYRFDKEEFAQLQALGAEHDDPLIHFALGKALQDREQPEIAFAHFTQANHSVRGTIEYDASSISSEVDRSIELFKPTLFSQLAGSGNESTDPIFIVGLPRAGSTLVEQILASHPLVEGTSELPYIPMLIHRILAKRWSNRSLVYPDVLRDIEASEFDALGQAYLKAARVHRRFDCPYFIDKLPNNWRYVGFIKLILPRAKIVDARREPMACLWSNYAQWFARGQEFSYDLADLAAYRCDYIRLAKHFDIVLPGAVRRVDHERLIANPEREIRELIDDLGLQFDPQCLHFNENQRPVRTASAQQVRRPIDRSSNEAWRKFEPWLGDLREQLEKS